ncbi:MULTISPECIES: restriction endonuclease subunit S [Heyndrickxia]|uniref:restriction endonuclease subunit S n=1 Tax=Heyndrickxia TaxID=2837504 RepID=UPI001B39F9DF|nr:MULTISPECIES: restriction endonuclease subunit S [Heyndrickxia]MBQ4911260.1 restriction endonuclease subunit S [Heyndrickxia faecalis]MED4839234.1 restriction endonuclease subunit S [Weizmannia sp. CD-2023]MED4866503.1 restriction endonuclease subunit S [Weizmannia sp. CD-2023]
MEEALVPEEEQPYEVRKNYKWVKLGSVISLISGRDVSSKLCNNDGKGIPYIMGASNIIDGKLNVERWIETPTVVGLKGDVLISVKGTVGKTVIQEIEKVHLSRQIMALRCTGIVCNRYLYYYINTYVKQLKENSKGIIPGISREDILNAPFPLASLKEQKRIVDKVERLLSKIDEAKRLIEEAKETFELRRAAILDKAFRGELTRKWREANLSTTITNNELNEERYIIPKEWKWTTIGEITTFVGSGSTPKGGSDIYQTEGIPFIRSQNVLRNKMDIENIVYISEEIYSKMKRTQMCGEETLLNITGASIGRAAKLSINLIPCNINQHVCALRFVDNINKDLPQYWLNSPYIQKIIREWQIGATRQALNFPQVRSLPFPLMPKEEQDELVKIISGLLGKEDKMRILTELDKSISQLKDSILSKAFRGELGTNDPDEESAIELLKEVLQEQTN